MMQRTLANRLLATGLILTLQFALLPVSADVAPATVSGSVLSSSDQTPLAGARVHVGNPGTGKIYTSAPVAGDGSFTVSDVPAATYELAVENAGRLFVVPTPLKLAPGVTQNVDVAVNEQASPDPATAEANAAKSAGSFWNNSFTAALIVLGSAIVVGVAVDAATDDDDGPMGSESNP
jgi:hypothetical protein